MKKAEEKKKEAEEKKKKVVALFKELRQKEKNPDANVERIKKIKEELAALGTPVED